MTSKDRFYTFVIVNGLLLIGGVVLFGVLLSRDLPSPGLSPEAHRALIEEMTSVDKLRGMAIRDDVYIRSLENLLSTLRTILLLSSIVIGTIALVNLVLIAWRKQKNEPSP